jgi:hypothetical protein
LSRMGFARGARGRARHSSSVRVTRIAWNRPRDVHRLRSAVSSCSKGRCRAARAGHVHLFSIFLPSSSDTQNLRNAPRSGGMGVGAGISIAIASTIEFASPSRFAVESRLLSIFALQPLRVQTPAMPNAVWFNVQTSCEGPVSVYSQNLPTARLWTIAPKNGPTCAESSNSIHCLSAGSDGSRMICPTHRDRGIRCK